MKRMKINPDIRFYDTSSLLLKGEKLFEKDEKFLISSITPKELERIKDSKNKDENIKYSARLLSRLLNEHQDCYEVIIHKFENEEIIKNAGLDINNDTRILSDAINANSKDLKYIDRVIFVTNDISLGNIANLFFGNKLIEFVNEDDDDYCGYNEIVASDQILSKFYNDITYNHFDLMIGQYLILKNSNGETIDLRVWTGNEHRPIKYKEFNSSWFGTIKPYKKDIYQKLLFDSLIHNKITMVKGPAGTGKSIVSLGYLMHQMENGVLDRIVVFCNTVATANSAKLGYYPGNKNEKLLDSQIGNMLASKFGGREAIEQLIAQEKLILLPFSDIRGYDTSGMRAGIYISEAQNLDRTLMKLALQRIGEDCICIIDGDEKSQVDMIAYKGSNNGMRRASKVFRGHDIYGEVRLKNIHRSEIAKIAELI